ncbi:MAG: hypothetical protein FGM57_00185 [Candidatus Taylorbacteria bacterium]|nr:hypothetical protein [Candidatus Taylorbacteria bacterium]
MILTKKFALTWKKLIEGAAQGKCCRFKRVLFEVPEGYLTGSSTEDPHTLAFAGLSQKALHGYRKRLEYDDVTYIHANCLHLNAIAGGLVLGTRNTKWMTPDDDVFVLPGGFWYVRADVYASTDEPGDVSFTWAQTLCEILSGQSQIEVSGGIQMASPPGDKPFRIRLKASNRDDKKLLQMKVLFDIIKGSKHPYHAKVMATLIHVMHILIMAHEELPKRANLVSIGINDGYITGNIN